MAVLGDAAAALPFSAGIPALMVETATCSVRVVIRRRWYSCDDSMVSESLCHQMKITGIPATTLMEEVRERRKRRTGVPVRRSWPSERERWKSLVFL